MDGLDEAQVRMALNNLKIMDVLRGKSGIGGKNRKEMGEHKFWATQPVPQIGMLSSHLASLTPTHLFFFPTGEAKPQEDGPIEPSKSLSEVRQNAYPLPKDFEWATVDVTDATEVCSGAHFSGIWTRLMFSSYS